MAPIQLKEAYVGLPTGGQVIEPGVYADDDPRVYGLASYLIELGMAIAVDVPTPVEPPVEPPAVDAQTAAEPLAADDPSGLPEVAPEIEGRESRKRK